MHADFSVIATLPFSFMVWFYIDVLGCAKNIQKLTAGPHFIIACGEWMSMEYTVHEPFRQSYRKKCEWVSHSINSWFACALYLLPGLSVSRWHPSEWERPQKHSQSGSEGLWFRQACFSRPDLWSSILWMHSAGQRKLDDAWIYP